jgi:PAS domain S-box-containing protein
MIACWGKLLHGFASRDEEYRLITKDGRIRWAIANGGPIFDQSGRQTGVQCSHRDITARKLAEKALRESELRFRELLEGVHLVALITNLDGTISFCNDYALAITGWTRQEVIGRPASEFLDTKSPPCAVANDCAEPFFEGSLLSKDGTRRWIQWSSTPLRDSASNPAGCARLGEDVTELHNLRAETARRESEEQFRNIADTAPLMIWVSGPDKGCTFVNKGWLAFTGRTFEEELGTGWTANIHPDDLESCISTYTSAVDARATFHVEYRKRRADGEYRWVLGSGAPRFGPDGEFAGYVGNCNDITDLKQSRDEDAARQKVETVGRLASGIAHDFNNLLGGVLVQAEMALEELEEGARPDEQLMNIRAVAIRGAGIVRQLMIYAGHESTGSEPVDVSELIEDMLELLKVVISKHVTLQTDLATGLPVVHANPAQLRQVVMNLVTNASEAIGELEGFILIRTAQACPRSDSPRFREQCVELAVSDTGCGIEPAVQTKVFDPFFTTKSAGHGLGLAVVHRSVEGLGGSIKLESKPGRGSTFRILLPAADGVAASERPATSIPTAQHLNGRPTVLIVEDEALLRLAVAKQLRKDGFHVIEAADGNEALDELHQRQGLIAVVLLDVTLPGASSRDVLAEVRRLQPRATVIVTSAYGQSTVDASFPGMKIDLFLRKPYQLVDLVSIVRSRPGTGEGVRGAANRS